MNYLQDAEIGLEVTLDELREMVADETEFARHVFAYLFPGRPSSIAARVLQLEEKVELLMSGFDDIKQAVADVATAVSDVAASLKSHPLIDNDPALKSMAIQLEGAAHTLESIANPPAPVVTPPSTTPPSPPAEGSAEEEATETPEAEALEDAPPSTTTTVPPTPGA